MMNPSPDTNHPSDLNHDREHLLIRYCAAAEVDGDLANHVKVLAESDIDWSYVIRTGLRHGVIALIQKSLRTICPEAVPLSMWDILSHLAQESLIKNFQLTSTLFEAYQLMELHGIRTIPFKGPLLGIKAYGGVGLRQFHDIDLLIHENDFQHVKEILTANGYQPLNQLTPTEERAHLRSSHVYAFVNMDGKLRLDVQWGVTFNRYQSFRLDFDRLWNDKSSMVVGQSSFTYLPAEDLLLFLCVHGARHNWSRLLWICDVARVVHTNPDLNWERTFNYAASIGCERLLRVGLLIASIIPGVSLPSDIRDAIQTDTVATWIAERFIDYLFIRDSVSPSYLESMRYQWSMRERVLDRIPYYRDTFHSLFRPNENDLRSFPLPSPLHFLYFGIKPMRSIQTRFSNRRTKQA